MNSNFKVINNLTQFKIKLESTAPEAKLLPSARLVKTLTAYGGMVQAFHADAKEGWTLFLVGFFDCLASCGYSMVSTALGLGLGWVSPF